MARCNRFVWVQRRKEDTNCDAETTWRCAWPKPICLQPWNMCDAICIDEIFLANISLVAALPLPELSDTDAFARWDANWICTCVCRFSRFRLLLFGVYIFCCPLKMPSSGELITIITDLNNVGWRPIWNTSGLFVCTTDSPSCGGSSDKRNAQRPLQFAFDIVYLLLCTDLCIRITCEIIPVEGAK